jgi:5-methylcytosine-specific restriction endonuclease McrA
MSKKEVRRAFRREVFKRDDYRCVVCHTKGYDRQEEPVAGLVPLDSHHIQDRHTFPNGGYVKSNGASLCDECHVKAEEYHSTGVALPGFAPEDLYALIGSSEAQARQDDANA